MSNRTWDSRARSHTQLSDKQGAVHRKKTMERLVEEF